MANNNGDPEWNTYANSIDFCEAHPNVLYAHKQPAWVVPGLVVRSEDGGKTWRFFAEPAPGKINGGGKLAVSATDPNRVVLAFGYHEPDVKEDPKRPFAQGIVYSADGGKTWKAALQPDGKLLPNFQHNDSAYNFDTVLAADRVDGAVFYAYRDDGTNLGDHPKPAEFWASRDGGLTWSIANAATLPQANSHDSDSPVQVAAMPGHAGEVWVGSNQGLFRSSDYGKTFAPVMFDAKTPFALNRPSLVAFGKPAPGKGWDTPTVYVFGRPLGAKADGYFYSTDLGHTWSVIPDARTRGLRPRTLTADRQVFGRFYGGSAQQNFIFYGVLTAPVQKARP